MPEDIQPIGFDNIRCSRLFTPEFTTIIQPIRDLGRVAVSAIVENGKGVSVPKKLVFDVALVERQTSKRKHDNV